MLAVNEMPTVEAASTELLEFALDPVNWITSGKAVVPARDRPTYQRKVGPLAICASVEVSSGLDAFLRVGFRSTGLTPLKAADLLETFLRPRFPFVPNSEWQVEIDDRRWIHFLRRYTAARLMA